MRLPFVFSLLLAALTSATVFGEPNKDWPHIGVERYEIVDDKTVQITYLTLWSSHEKTDVRNGGTFLLTDENRQRWRELHGRLIAMPSEIEAANKKYDKRVFKGTGDATLPGNTTPRQFVEFVEQLQVSPPPPDKKSPQPGQPDTSAKPSGDPTPGASGSAQPSQPNRKPMKFRFKLEEIRPDEFRKVWDIHSDSDQLSWSRVNFDPKSRYNLKRVGSEGEYEIFEEVMPQASKAKDGWSMLIGKYKGVDVFEITNTNPAQKITTNFTVEISGTPNSPKWTIQNSAGDTGSSDTHPKDTTQETAYNESNRTLEITYRQSGGRVMKTYICVDTEGNVTFWSKVPEPYLINPKCVLTRISDK